MRGLSVMLYQITFVLRNQNFIMDRNPLLKSVLIFALAISLFSFNTKAIVKNRTIELAGLVVNAKDLSPIAGAELYGSNGKSLGTTDEKGYYDIKFNYAKRASFILS